MRHLVSQGSVGKLHEEYRTVYSDIVAPKQRHEDILLTAIVPIGGFPNSSEQMESWLAQELPKELEIILVLDTDDLVSAGVVQQLAEASNHYQIRHLRSHHRNPGGARNVGLAEAKGKWVTFWDSDDVPNVRNFLQMIRDGEQLSSEIVIGNYNEYEYQTITSTNIELNHQDRFWDIYQNPGIWRFGFNRELAKGNPFPELSMAEDQIFIFKILARNPKIVFTDSIVYTYYKYPSGQLTKNNKALLQLITANKILLEFNKRQPNSYVEAALIKQNLTIIKRGILQNKARSALRLLKLVLTSKAAFKSLNRILRGI